jgi:hypothetical protein
VSDTSNATDPAISSVTSTRMPGLEGILKPPQRFIAIDDGNHPQSVRMVDALQGARLPAIVLVSHAALPIYLREKRVAPRDTVMLVDGSRRKGFFTSLCRLLPAHQSRIPKWINEEILWVIALSPRLVDKQITIAVRQIRCDFFDRFISQIERGEMPWGLPLVVSPSHRRRERERNKKSVAGIAAAQGAWL